MNKVLTANRLSDGIAVWLGANGQWIETLDTALIARHQEAVDALEVAGKAAFNKNLVVDIFCCTEMGLCWRQLSPKDQSNERARPHFRHF